MRMRMRERERELENGIRDSSKLIKEFQGLQWVKFKSMHSRPEQRAKSQVPEAYSLSLTSVWICCYIGVWCVGMRYGRRSVAQMISKVCSSLYDL